MLRIQIDTPQIQYYIFICSKMSGLVFCFLQSISYLNTLIVRWSILLLILIKLFRLCVYFYLIWSVHLLLAFFLQILIFFHLVWLSDGEARKISEERNFSSYCNSLTSYVFYFFYSPLLYMISSEYKVNASGNTLF